MSYIKNYKLSKCKQSISSVGSTKARSESLYSIKKPGIISMVKKKKSSEIQIFNSNNKKSRDHSLNLNFNEVQRDIKTIDFDKSIRTMFSQRYFSTEKKENNDIFRYSSNHFNKIQSFKINNESYGRDDHITYKNGYFNNKFNKNFLIHPEMETIKLKTYKKHDSYFRIFGTKSLNITPEKKFRGQGSSVDYNILTNIDSINNTIDESNNLNSISTYKNDSFPSNMKGYINIKSKQTNIRINKNFGSPLKTTVESNDKKAFLPLYICPNHSRYQRETLGKGQSTLVVGDENLLTIVNQNYTKLETNKHFKIKSITQICPNNRRSKVEIDWNEYLSKPKNIETKPVEQTFFKFKNSSIFDVSKSLQTSTINISNVNSRANSKDKTNIKDLLSNSFSEEGINIRSRSRSKEVTAKVGC